jgi:hypothetical protein
MDANTNPNAAASSDQQSSHEEVKQQANSNASSEEESKHGSLEEASQQDALLEPFNPEVMQSTLPAQLPPGMRPYGRGRRHWQQAQDDPDAYTNGSMAEYPHRNFFS